MSSALVWFRRDLRDFDHAALYHALKNYQQVFCAFVFDADILDALPRRGDRRVEFIHGCVAELDSALRARGGGLIVRHARAREAIPTLAQGLGVDAVLANRDYEPAAQARDSDVAERLRLLGIGFADFKDQVIFEKAEILTQGGGPFSVFTPYKRAWLKTLTDFHLKSYPVDKYASRLAPPPEGERVPDLATLGFDVTNLAELGITPGMMAGRRLFEDFLKRIGRYKARRDFPAVKGVSYLSVHLRFGTVSIRELARAARDAGGEGADTWLSELVWRDFYFQILWHHPRVAGASFRPEYDRVAWDRGELRACVDLGLRLIEGERQGVAQDPVAARALFEKACDGGVLPGCHALGVLYQQAIGVAPNHARARDLYLRACRGGHLLGCVSLGGIDELLERPDRALLLYQRACAGGEELGCKAACRLGDARGCELAAP